MEKPIRFDEFLEYQWYQRMVRLKQFEWARDPTQGNCLISKSFLAFYLTAFFQAIFYGCTIYGVVLALRPDQTSNINPPVVSIAVYFTSRGTMLFLKRYDIVKLLNILDKEFPQGLEEQKELNVGETYAKYRRRYKFVNIYSDISQAVFCVLPVCFFLFATGDQDAPLTLDQQLLGGWLPFGLRQNRSVYFVIWIFDVYTLCCGTSFFITFDILFNMMATHLIMHLKALTRRLEDIDATDSLRLDYENEFFAKMGGLVQRQQYLNRLCDMYNDIFKMAILLSNFVGAVTICFHLYLMTEITDLFVIAKYMFPNLALVGFTFDLCLRGTQLEEASACLHTALYNQNWYMGSRKHRKFMLLWLHYSQSTRKLEAYGLTHFNMEHFTDFMQLAYKLFTFLKSH